MQADGIFPNLRKDYDNLGQEIGLDPIGGLTKREWFAGLALQGLLASGICEALVQLKISPEEIKSHVTSTAVSFADETLERLAGGR